MKISSRLFTILTLLVLLTPPIVAARQSSESLLYRTRVWLHYPADLQRLHSMGVHLLDVQPGIALVVVDELQLAALARKGFSPHETDSLEQLLGERVDANQVAAYTAVLTTLPMADADGDGLSDTEEAWWCTNPADPDTDGDTFTDGTEVTMLLAGDYTYGPPFLKWPDWSQCYDGDFDVVPDAAEIHVIGSNSNRESTDGDKFDDGQEFFGITIYPSYGALPRPEDDFITANMPGWVDPPGNNIFVSAHPLVSINILQDTIDIQLVTEVTAGETHQQGETFTYGTACTQGTSESVGKTETHTTNWWQEVTNTEADEYNRTHYESNMTSKSYQYTKGYTKGWHAEAEIGGYAEVTTGAEASVNCDVKVNVGCGAEVGASVEGTLGATWAFRGGIERQSSESQSYGFEVSHESGDSWGYTHVQERSLSRGQGYEVGYAATIEQSTYEEATVTNDHSIATSEEWSTATAVNSAHAADLYFSYRIANEGTDNARQIENLIFNIYIGGIKNPITYQPGQSMGGLADLYYSDDGPAPAGQPIAYDTSRDIDVIENLYPGEAILLASEPIALNLEQLRAIDEGAPIQIVVESFSYGTDQQFYQDSWGRSVIIEIDDGVSDGDELVDRYMIVTWGDETYQDVLKRYFRVLENTNGDLYGMVTPEYNADHEIIGYQEHNASALAWWDFQIQEPPLLAQGGMPTLTTSFSEEAAYPETRLFLRYNQDSDGDFYSDRTEMRIGTSPSDSSSHPAPEMITGFYEVIQGDDVRVELSLANLGNYDASGIQSVLYALDDSISVTNNLVGGAGTVRVGEHVILGGRVGPAGLADWTGSAMPLVTGYYSGTADKVYTFQANESGWVGETVTLTLSWTDGAGNSGTIPVGAEYASPTPLDLAEGIKVAFLSGDIVAGEVFTCPATLPRDTFSYHINRHPYTKPAIIVSYNDAQGHHKFLTWAELDQVDASLEPYRGGMVFEPELTLDTIHDLANGEKMGIFLFYNPDVNPIEDAHLMLEYATLEGEILQETVLTRTLFPGDNFVIETWNEEALFPGATNPRYKIVAFVTDWQGSVIDLHVQKFGLESWNVYLPLIEVGQ